MTTSTKRPDGGEQDKFWLELREPKCVPERKGPFPIEKTSEVLREFLKARPQAMISVVTVGFDGPYFQDAPECLMMTDYRSRTTALKHIETSNAATTPTNESPAPQPPVEGLKASIGQIIDAAMNWRTGPGEQSYIEACADFQAMLNTALAAGENTKSDGGEHGGERTRTVQAGLDEGLGPMQAVPQAADACSAPSDPPLEDALGHLGSVLSILAELHPDDRSRALDNALAFYNARRPGAQVEPVAGVTRLVHQWPGPSDPSPTAPAFDVMQTIDPDYAESFERSLDLPQSAPLIGPSHNSGERLPIDKAESGADTPPTASAPDVREALEWVRGEIFALCEATEDSARDGQDFSRGRCLEAKRMRRAMGEVIRERLAALSQQPVAVADQEAITPFSVVERTLVEFFSANDVQTEEDGGEWLAYLGIDEEEFSLTGLATAITSALLHPPASKG